MIEVVPEYVRNAGCRPVVISVIAIDMASPSVSEHVGRV